MSNNKRLAVILSSALFLCSIVIMVVFISQPNNSNPEKEASAAQGSLIEETETSMPPKKPLSVEGSLVDYTYDINDMRDQSDMIAVGKVVSQQNSSRVSVGSVVQISKIFKGKPLDEIVVIQLGQVNEETVIEPGKSYLFFLGDQGVENKYFPKGGIQGLFLIDNEILIPQDDIMMKELTDSFGEEVTFNANAKSTSSFERWLTE